MTSLREDQSVTVLHNVDLFVQCVSELGTKRHMTCFHSERTVGRDDMLGIQHGKEIVMLLIVGVTGNMESVEDPCTLTD